MSSFCPPPQLQLTLALAVVKSKPSNTTIRGSYFLHLLVTYVCQAVPADRTLPLGIDHIIGMRDCLVVGRRREIESTGDKQMDGTAFWRKAYEKSEAAQVALQDKIYELQQKNEALLLRVKPTDAPEIPSFTAKRKANTDDTLLQPVRSQKRSKTMGVGKGSGNSLSTELDLLNSGALLVI